MRSLCSFTTLSLILLVAVTNGEAPWQTCRLDKVMQKPRSFDLTYPTSPETKYFPCRRADCPLTGLPKPGRQGMLEVEVTESMLQAYNYVADGEYVLNASRYSVRGFLEPLSGLVWNYLLYLVPCFEFLRGEADSPLGKSLGGPFYRYYADYAFGEPVLLKPTPVLKSTPVDCVPAGALPIGGNVIDWCVVIQPVRHRFTKRKLRNTFHINRKQVQQDLGTLFVPLDPTIHDNNFLACNEAIQDAIFDNNNIWNGYMCEPGLSVASWACLGMINGNAGLRKIINHLFPTFPDNTVKCFPEMVFETQYTECDSRIQDFAQTLGMTVGYFGEELCLGKGWGNSLFRVLKGPDEVSIIYAPYRCIKMSNPLDGNQDLFFIEDFSENEMRLRSPPCTQYDEGSRTFPTFMGLGDGEWCLVGCHDDRNPGDLYIDLPTNCPLTQSRFDCGRQTKPWKCKNNCSWCKKTKTCIPSKSAVGTFYAPEDLAGYCTNNALAKSCPLSFSKCPSRDHMETCNAINTITNKKKRKKLCKEAKSAKCRYCAKQKKCIASGYYSEAPLKDLCESSLINKCT